MFACCMKTTVELSCSEVANFCCFDEAEGGKQKGWNFIHPYEGEISNFKCCALNVNFKLNTDRNEMKVSLHCVFFFRA